ncbi:hypothetical protein OsJ_28194 [Oryza sativa Japonica Group]|uniref:Uncharacterized protein n=1 Tax=Oryza sativa subsp. japonica TaxID=39947 RepID=Q6ZJI8_ORYSJ|nr:hypothetical protein OsJ_28194 [Oryza sativa Japonica Group]BAD08954.1 hypothetical protein [Oryza sativa Japonica Group]
MTARRLPASTRPTTHCSATFSPSSISLEFHIPDDWICEKDKAVEHQEGMAKILRHTKKAPATKEVLLSFPPSPEKSGIVVDGSFIFVFECRKLTSDGPAFHFLLKFTLQKQMEGKFADEAMKNNRCISSVTIFGACSLLYDHYP